MDENNLKPEGRTGSVKLLGRLSRYWFSVEVRVMREGLNNNKWDYRNIKDHYLSFLGQPILIAYVGKKIGDGHNMRAVPMPDGGTEYTFIDGSAERVIGTLSEKESDFRLEEINGNLWIVAKGKIFAFYAREAVEKIIDTGSMDVSAETEIYDGESAENGVEIFTNWAGLGVTILGDDVPPAIPGARIKAMNASADVRDMNLRAASLQRQEGAESPKGKTTKKGVKHDMNKREYARLQKQFDGYTVLGATENGLNVCLLSDKDGAAAGYRFADDADKNGIVPERICNMSVNCQFAFDEENAVDIELGQITDVLSAKLISANASIEEKDKKIADLEAKVKEMEAKELTRRVNDAKKAVMARLDTLNRDREERCAYSKKLADEVCARCESGCFNECMKDGEWCGDQMAVMELEAACAREQEQIDKANAEKAKKAVSWNAINLGADREESDADALMAWAKQ